MREARDGTKWRASGEVYIQITANPISRYKNLHPYKHNMNKSIFLTSDTQCFLASE